MAKTKFCEGLSDISDSYMAIIFDEWGVLHNGKKAYDGVVDCLKELRSRKKTIILLSNHACTAAENKERLKKIGIGPSLYDKIITTGDYIATHIADKDKAPFDKMGKKCFMFHSGDPFEFMKDCDVTYVEKAEDADFALVTGWDKFKGPAAEYEDTLKTIVRKGIQTIFAVPDSQALFHPSFITGPGVVVRKLKNYGGVITSVGKPYKPIFHEVIEYLQSKDIYPGQAVMVGDTMAHDMIGADVSEIDSCFVRSGIHAGAFRNASGPADIDQALNVLIAQYNIRPTYLIEQVRWGKALPDRKHRRRLQPGERVKRRLRRRPIKDKK